MPEPAPSQRLPTQEKLFLGLDGGQSHTQAVLGDAKGRIVGRGLAGPSNHAGSAKGREKLVSAVTGAMGHALDAAGRTVADAHFAAVCCGMSGGPDDKRDILAEIINADRLEVVTDAYITLWGATEGGPGIIVIAGTGSIAFGQNAEGKAARAGGWGYVFGDEGGAFDIVRRALRAALQYEEGWGPRTVLHDSLLAACHASTANELMHRFYTQEFPHDKIASLAPRVNEAASMGDRVARRVLADAANELARLAKAVRTALFQDDDEVLVTASGGVFQNQLIAEEFRENVSTNDRNLVVPPKHEPAVGALLRAYQLAGLRVEISR